MKTLAHVLTILRTVSPLSSETTALEDLLYACQILKCSIQFIYVTASFHRARSKLTHTTAPYGTCDV